MMDRRNFLRTAVVAACLPSWIPETQTAVIDAAPKLVTSVGVFESTEALDRMFQEAWNSCKDEATNNILNHGSRSSFLNLKKARRI